MSFRAIAITDLHIHDDSSEALAVRFIERAVTAHRPDVVLCLGDMFDGRRHLESRGERLKNALLAVHAHWLFVFGNHDGSSTSKGKNEEGLAGFTAVFGPGQQAIDIRGRRFVTLANAQDDSDWVAFARREVTPGAVVLSHIPLSADLADELARKGARLMLAGHVHTVMHMRHEVGLCDSHVLPPFLFGGRAGDPAGYAVIDFDGTPGGGNITDLVQIRLEPQLLDPMPGHAGIVPASTIPFVPSYRRDAAERLAVGALAPWCRCRPNTSMEWTVYGGPSRAAVYRDGALLWDKKFGRSSQDTVSPQIVRHAGRNYLILSGTWVSPGPDNWFGSVVVADLQSGEELYRIGIVGVSAAPTVADGVMYVVGQWREIIAVDLAGGRELWRRRSQIERPEAPELSWYDGHVGGGWSWCSPAVGRHLWTVNARGDLFGYDPQSGELRVARPAVIPVNGVPACPFANRLACMPERFETAVGAAGTRVWRVNGCEIDDATGTIRLLA